MGKGSATRDRILEIAEVAVLAKGFGATSIEEIIAEAGITKSSGKPLPGAGLGLLKGSLCVHYSNEPDRRAAYLEAVAGGMPGGYGLDDYAGLIWEGTGPPSAVTAQRGARAYRVAKGDSGVVESPLPARFLPAPAPAALREDIAEFRRISAMRKRAGWPG